MTSLQLTPVDGAADACTVCRSHALGQRRHQLSRRIWFHLQKNESDLVLSSVPVITSFPHLYIFCFISPQNLPIAIEERSCIPSVIILPFMMADVKQVGESDARILL